LRAQVTSKGGTTEAALAVLNEHCLGTMVEQAVAAAAGQSAFLARNQPETNGVHSPEP